MGDKLKTVTIIAGATASGKTKFSLDFAQNHNGTIINADSQQLYKSLPILTAQPNATEQSLCPHALFGALNDEEYMSAAAWAEAAATLIKQAWIDDKHPILVGGTGFYLKALLDGFSPIPNIPLSIRDNWIQNFADIGADEFHKDLMRDDPATAARLHKHDKQRLIRAREVLDVTKKSLTEWQNLPPIQILPEAIYKIYIINLPRDILYDRCNKRIHHMIELGALEEVKTLYDSLHNKSAPVTKALGYPQFLAYLNNEITFDEAVKQTALTTRHYAKRQVTWFNNQIKPQPNITSIEIINHAV